MSEQQLPAYYITAIVAACAAPTAALNIWPRIEMMMEKGLSGNQIGIVILVTMSALGMAAIPFAMKKAENWGFWSLCAIFGAFLCLLNYAMAVGAIGKVYDHETNTATNLQNRAKAIETKISSLQREINNLPAFKWTTNEMVDTAGTAVALALQAREQECGKVGDYCRARVVQLAARQSDLAEANANRALTVRKEKLNSALAEEESKKLDLGTIPTYVDPQAARLASFLSVLHVPVGPTPIETVANGLIQVLAIAAEIFGLLMPRGLVTALSPHPTAGQTFKLPTPPTLDLKAVEVFTPKQISPPRKKRGELTPRDWQMKYLSRSPGDHLAANTAYLAYRSRVSEPLSFEAFDKQILVQKDKRGKELLYLHSKLI